MENASYIGLSRQLVLQRHMDVIAHNLANMTTPAFKEERMVFVEYLSQPARNEKMSFVQDIGLWRNLDEGPMEKTDNPLDVGISGDGYFTVQTEDGPRYTRHGRFSLDRQNQLVNSIGQPVLSDGGSPISIPPGSQISVATDGTVSNQDGQLGKIGVVTFENEQILKRDANNLYRAEEGQIAQPTDEARLLQGMLEKSNVQPVLEVSRMIEVHRAYASATSFLQTEHEREQRAIRALAQTRG